MKVGILSDTHDQLPAAEGALQLFRAEGVGLVIHLGDVCSPIILERYRDASIPLVGVFGNNDWDRDGIQSASGGVFHQGPHVETVGERRILLAHSYDQLQGRLDGQRRFDLVLFGHTHRPLTMQVGKTLVLNPGESCGLVGGINTCAIVELCSMEARIVEIPLAGGD